MPENIPHFTKCARPGDAHSFSALEPLVAFVVAGGLAGLVVYLIPLLDPAIAVPCGATAIVVVVGLIAALGQFRSWYYNSRLMCVLDDQCAVGTLVGKPCLSCDGDRKLDLLIAPFGYREIDGPLLAEAIANRAAAEPALPPPPAGLDGDRNARLAYLKTVAEDPALGNDALKRIYLELVHNIMFDSARFPGRQFQSRYYRREPPPVMPQDAFDESPPDTPDLPDPNALFKFDGLAPSTGFDFVGALCSTLLQFDDKCEEGKRLLPFLHCEVEGDRMDRAIAAVQAALGFLAFTWAAVCGICTFLGGPPVLCTLAGALAGLLIALLVWLTGPWFFDFEEGEAGDIPVDVPDPTGEVGTTTSEDGDVILVRGKWIKDTEHTEYFEIHPVKAWYLICRDANGTPTRSSDATDPNCAFDVTRLIESASGDLCDLTAKAEEDIPIVLRVTGEEALAMAAGLLAESAEFGR